MNLGRVANELQEGIMKVRMLPVAHLFNRYPRLVRDLVKVLKKIFVWKSSGRIQIGETNPI